MTDEDDDWFEQAITEDEEREDGTAGEDSRHVDGEPDEGGGDALAGEVVADEPSADDVADETHADTTDVDETTVDGTGADDRDAVDADAAEVEEWSEDIAAGETDERNAADTDAGDGGESFADEFTNAFEDAWDTSTEGDSGRDGDDGSPFGGGDESGPFDGNGGESDPFGGDGDSSPFGGDGDSSPFGGDGSGDFGMGGDSALGGGGGDDFGMSDFGGAGGDGTDFSDEALESDIDRIDLGIEGLDDMIRGGVPERSLMAIIGSAGTGKTTFGLQFLREGLSSDEKGIYITLEESRERVIRSAEEKGWSFESYAADDQLAIVDIDPIEMANSLSSIRSELPQLVEQFGASRLVLDSVSLLEMMYDDRATRRNEIYTFTRSLKESGVSVLLTSEADEDNPYASRHGIVEYLTDAVYVLRFVRPTDFRETRLAVEIQKIRDAHHSREMKPYEITDEGLSVYRQANIF